MNQKSFVKFIGILGFLAGYFTSCSSDCDSHIVLPNQKGDDSPISADTSISAYELVYNYLYLNVFYAYAHTNNELSENIEDYYQKPVQEQYGKSICVPGSAFTDVCYMYSQMKDPYTRYYDPSVAEFIYSLFLESDKTTGVGVELESIATDEDSVFVFSQVYPKSPAALAGITTNDTLESVSGKKPQSIEEAQQLLTGNIGDVLEVSFKRGSETKQVSVTVNQYLSPTVFVSYEDSIPVIRISEFASKTVSDSGTYGEFYNALKETDWAKSTIIDLRKNPGGDVSQCHGTASELLSEGDTIIIDIESTLDSVAYVDDNIYAQQFDTSAYIVSRDGIAKDRYLVFLADSGSASCAELMLSAVTVNKKDAPVIGLTTYGKGIGQAIQETYANGLFFITALQSMDKNRNIYHKVGIVPDFESGDPDEQMKTAVEWAKAGTQLREAGYGTTSTGHFAKARISSTTSIPKTRRELLKQLGGAAFKKYEKGKFF